MLKTLKLLLIIACLSSFALPKLALADVQLLMFETNDCPYCKKWDREISHIYPKTKEGKIAILKRYDFFEVIRNIKFKHRVKYSPTFILIQDEIEVGRIEGYASEEQFWTSLSLLFTNANILLTN